MLELAERLGVAGTPAQDHYDLVVVGGGPAGLARRGLRRVGGTADRHGRARGARRAGRPVQPDRELPRLPGGPERLGPRAPRHRPGAPPRRGAADRPGRRRAARRGRRPVRRAVRRGRPERELRADRVGRLLPPDDRARLRRADRRRRLLRRRDDRGALVRTAARRRHRRRELRRPGGRALQRLRRPGDDARPRAVLGGLDVALPRRAARGAAERRGAHGQLGDRGGGRGRAPAAAADRAAPRGSTPRTSTPASSSSAPRRTPTGSRTSSRATSTASSSPAPTCTAPAWPLPRDPFLLETSVPGVFVAGDVRARSIKRVASAVGEGAMAVSLIHQYLVEG